MQRVCRAPHSRVFRSTLDSVSIRRAVCRHSEGRSQERRESRLTDRRQTVSMTALRLHQEWDGADWINDSQYSYEYDLNNNLTLYLRQEWDGAPARFRH